MSKRRKRSPLKWTPGTPLYSYKVFVYKTPRVFELDVTASRDSEALEEALAMVKNGEVKSKPSPTGFTAIIPR